MRRRTLIGFFASAAFTWPITVSAEQASLPVVGFLNSSSPDRYARYVSAFRQGLGETGYVEGRNVIIEYRWANDQYDRLPAEVTR